MSKQKVRVMLIDENAGVLEMFDVLHKSETQITLARRIRDHIEHKFEVPEDE